MTFQGDFEQHTGIDWRGNVGRVRYGDDNMVVLFYYRPTLNTKLSQEHGRPYYEDVVYVRYHPPAERLNINDRPATDEHKRRWPLQWAQFSQNKEQVNDGTRVEILYPEHPSIAATLRGCRVFTVEQLAALEGTQIDSIGMGAQKWVNDARQFIEAAEKGVKASQMRAALEQRDGQIRTLEHHIELLKGEVSRLSTTAGGVSLAQVQAMIAGAQGRPTVPGGMGSGGGPTSKTFDAATAQINAAHPTAEIGKRQRPKG